MKTFRKQLNKILVNQQGASLIFSLIVILILLALATTLLTMSVGNIRLASSSSQLNYTGSLQETVGQFYLNEVDALLADAEREAQLYFQNNYFAYTEADIQLSERALSPSLKKFLNSGHQTYFYSKWLKEINGPATIKKVNVYGSVEKKISHYMSTKYFDAYYKEVFPYIYYYLAYEKLSTFSSQLNENEMKNALESYVAENASLKDSKFDASKYNLDAFTINFQNLGQISELLTKKLLTDSDVQTVYNTLSRMELHYSVDLLTGKTLQVSAKILAPKTQSIQQVTKRNVYGNPIWGNAITANGQIRFEDAANCIIDGDVFSGVMDANKDSILVQAEKVTVSGNVYAKGNLKIIQDADTNISSVFTINKRSGREKVVDKMKIYDGSPYLIKLKNRTAFGYVKKDNNELFKASVAAQIRTEDKIDKERQMPYLFDDSVGGNLYARGIVVDPKVTYNDINVNGNTVFFDDILNAGKYDSDINLNGYVIGLDQLGIDVSTFGKDTAAHFEMAQSDDGSCIKNYRGDMSNTIIINAPMVFIPGNAILKDDNNKPYKTGTGVIDATSKPLYLKPYELIKDINYGNAEAGALEDRSGVYNFETVKNIKLGEAEASKKNYIEDNANMGTGELATDEVSSGIRIQLSTRSKKSYIQGTSFFQTDAFQGIGNNYMHVLGRNTNYFNTDLNLYDEYMGYIAENAGISANEFKNMYVYEYIYRIFKSKTQHLGLWEIGSIGNLVNVSVITDPDKYLDVDQKIRGFFDNEILNSNKGSAKFLAYKDNLSRGECVMNLDEFPEEVSQRLVYADGNLTIVNTDSRTKTIKGGVIANGNVTIKGNVEIVYDEPTIKSILESSYYAREFFQPGETGIEIAAPTQEMISARGRKLEAGERLDLIKWTMAPSVKP